jgi:hypothetical protein
MTMKKIPAPARSNDSVAGRNSRVRGAPRPNRQGRRLGLRAKPNRRQPDGRFRFSDHQWDPIRDRSGFDDKARKCVEQLITIYRNERESELLAAPPAKTRNELTKLQTLADDLWKQIEHCLDDARAWDMIFGLIPKLADPASSSMSPLARWFNEIRWFNGLLRLAPASDGGAAESMSPQSDINWDSVRLYTFQDDVKEFADLIGRAKDRVESAPPGARAHHNLNMLIHSLVSMWEEIHATKFTRTKKRSGPNRMHNGTEFMLRVCKIAEPDCLESTFENAIRYVVEHKAELDA